METQQAAHGAGGSGPVTDVGQDEALVREFAQAVLEGAAPEELLLFDETVADYRRDPDAVLDPRRREEAVGFGLDLGMLTPLVLAVAPAVLTFLAQTVAGVVREESKPVLSDLVRRLFRRVGLQPQGEKDDGLQPRQGKGDGVQASGAEGDDLAISRAQADEVRRIVLARAADLKVPEEHARLLADSVVGGLVTQRA